MSRKYVRGRGIRNLTYPNHDDRDRNDNYNNQSNSRQQNNRYQNNRGNRALRTRGIVLRRGTSSRYKYESPRCEFYKITIPGGAKLDRKYLISLIKQNIDDITNSYTFYNIATEQNSLVFYVTGSERADTLRSLSRRITTDNGVRLVILVHEQQNPPDIPLSEALVEVIKRAMSRLYCANTGVMDLSKFSEASEFREEGLYMSISRPNMIRAILTIIKQETPNIVALNMSDNKIFNLEPFQILAKYCPSLKALDLSKNRISNVGEIDNLKDMDLLELILEGNSFIDKDYTSRAAYISAMRKIFKNLRKLDSEDLPEQIGFDLGETQNLPQTKDEYFPNAEVKNGVLNFLERYYDLYDSENRQPLMQFYHEQAIMTLALSRRDQSSHFYKPSDAAYQNSHNLLRIRDESLWVKLVKTSSLEVVSFLCKMPVTKHLPDSFKIDVPFVSPKLLVVVINGLFNETYKSNSPMRAFCRTFYIVPDSQANFAIVNDMLMITTPSISQISANKQDSHVLKLSKVDKMIADVEFQPVESGQAGPSHAAPPLLQPSPNESIIQEFMAVTKMNRTGSIQCLEEFNYNPIRALEVFQTLKENNALPAHFFQ